ncbi:hypothetical protein ABIE44_001977 [Marmoricola sp. OAE513]|uniref:hypothetical protein n=1 Tax=Marmoricola sp. OAE513 TaxID=2817894 RepID=UPI001AE15F0C
MRSTTTVAAVLVVLVLQSCGSSDAGRPTVDDIIAAMPRYGDGTRAYARCMAEALHASALSDETLRAMIADEDYEPPVAQRTTVRAVSGQALSACSHELVDNSPVR